jgi:hypothetical protein
MDEDRGIWMIGASFPMADWPQQGHSEASGNNPFWMIAPKLGFAQITARMVSHYMCNLEAQTKNNETALHLAAYFGHAKVVQTLLELGANIEHKNKYGETALDSSRKGLGVFKTGKFAFPKMGSGRFDLRTYDVDWPHWEGEDGVIQMLKEAEKKKAAEAAALKEEEETF